MSNTDSNIWIWGISSAGKLLYRYLVDNKCNIKGIIDNSPLYRGFNYHDIPIYSYLESKKMIAQDDLIIISTRRTVYDEILKELNEDGYKNVSWIYEYISFEKYTNNLIDNFYENKYISKLCDAKDFDNIDFHQIYNMIKDVPRANGNHIIYHRKTWEWCYITLLLQTMGFLENGKKGVGFAVGREPLPALFASYGVEILATDLAGDTEIAKGWSKNNENAGSTVKNLYYPFLCDKDIFYERVTYEDVDMNTIPEHLLRGEFDFCWSSCAIEHVGSLDKSKIFLKNMIGCLKPGGIAIHTTEFNLSSDEDTIEYGGNVIWRKKDIIEIQNYLINNGCSMDVSFQRENSEANSYIDMPPFEGEGKPYHMNLVIDGFSSTSIALVIRKEK